MAVRFLGISRKKFLEDYKKLFHYTPERYLDDILKENTHRFSNPMTWKDPYEKYFLNPKYKVRGEKMAPNYMPIRNKVYCKCFTSQYQCEPFWGIHSGGAKTVCITFDTERLLEELDRIEGYKVYIGKVKYLGQRELSGVHPDGIDLRSIFILNKGTKREINNSVILQLRLLLLKRRAFNYENEIRIFLLPKTSVNNADHVQLQLPCGAKEIISKLTFDPRYMENTTGRDQFILMRERYNSDPFNIQCVLSSLYKETSRMTTDEKTIII